MASIKGLSSVFPKHKVFQEEIKEIGRKLFSSKIQFKKMEKFMIIRESKLGILLKN